MSMQRRDFLKAGFAGITLTGLAGCAGTIVPGKEQQGLAILIQLDLAVHVKVPAQSSEKMRQIQRPVYIQAMLDDKYVAVVGIAAPVIYRPVPEPFFHHLQGGFQVHFPHLEEDEPGKRVCKLGCYVPDVLS